MGQRAPHTNTHTSTHAHTHNAHAAQKTAGETGKSNLARHLTHPTRPLCSPCLVSALPKQEQGQRKCCSFSRSRAHRWVFQFERYASLPLSVQVHIEHTNTYKHLYTKTYTQTRANPSACLFRSLARIQIHFYPLQRTSEINIYKLPLLET